MTARTNATINVVDLFAGCGGFTQGFHAYKPEPGQSSPFRSIAAVEFDQAAAATYAANFGGDAETGCDVFAGDIKEWDPTPYKGKVDVILGGPPCQGFSGLGAENPLDPRNKLWREYVKVVAALEPKIFVIENVDRFYKSAEYRALLGSNMKGLLRNYTLTEQKVLNAADYGVPQARRRAIVIATHKDLPALKHPSPTHEKKKSPEGLFDPSGRHPWETVEYIFKKTPVEPATTELPDARVEILGASMPGIYTTRDLHIGRNPTPLSRARYRAIGPGQNRNALRGRTAVIDGKVVELSTASWDRHDSGSGDVMGRLRIDSPAVTIRTEFFKPEKGRYLHPTANRPITHYEAALIQGFPEEFRWCGSKIQIARQIGNAVPVGLSEALARHIHQHLASV
ncbi:DNA cytosine methyltransferase [Streptomyces sp. SP18CS02]|uniref:DNA cytosine methyltransferase n=1 Tax=Streptomyces sp. SP18CS02 TaxID=3002531 RepID=UPI002E791A3B|nr:DNA cytosine methyltransferase [Streptomyces sp. SP18CS02]MEE1752326.1 DNA cytosine methyltransferase [Streptomyces sp. SP18CS02]